MHRLRNPWEWLTWGATAAALLLCFWGKLQHFWALLTFFIPWWIRLYFSAESRTELAENLSKLWQSCKDYPLRCDSPPWRAAIAFVAIPAAVVFLTNDFVSEGDNVPVMLAATSLASEGNWELSEFVNRPEEYPYLGVLQRTEKGLYSAYPSGPVQFALPVVLISKFVGGDYRKFSVQRRLHKWTAAWLAAGCLSLFFLTCLHLVEAGPALVIAALLATGSAMFTTIGQGLWQHGGILFWTQFVLLLEFRQAIRPAPLSSLWRQGLALGCMLACRLSAAIIIGPLLAWMFLRDWRRGTIVGVLMAAFYLPWAWIYYSHYGQPFGPSMGQLGWFSMDREYIASALFGSLFSPARGFFVYQVWAFLIAGSLLASIASRTERSSEKCPTPIGWQGFCAVSFLANLAMVSTWGMWWGGHCWGSRLLSDSMLLYALLCVRPLARLWECRSGRRLILAMAAIGFLINAPAVYMAADRWNAVSADPERMWSWQDPPFLYPILRAWNGEAD